MVRGARVDLTDSELFVRNEFWAELAWLRAHDPVHWHPGPDGSGFWVVTRYRDIVSAYVDHQSFSSRFGMRLDSNSDAVSAVAQRMLIVSDPPEHTQLKRVLARSFGHAELAHLGVLVRDVVRDVVTTALECGDMDFVDVVKTIPNHVVSAFMELPRADWEWIGRITTEAFEGADEARRSGAHGEIFLYFSELVQRRRNGDGDDFISRVARARRATDVSGDERPLTDEEIVVNCNGVLAGANETTRYSAAGGLLALAENPEQWRALHRGGDEAVLAAVEEILRWTVPGIHALRTVMRPKTIGETWVRPGERVTLWNASANRDESVFPDPDRFRVDRSPNRHVTFGAGRHSCLGAGLARLELTVLLSELVKRVDAIEVLGEPQYNASNFTWGLRRLPVRLHAKRGADHHP